MSLIFCPTCDALIDTDFNAEHLDTCNKSMPKFIVHRTTTTTTSDYTYIEAENAEEAERLAQEDTEENEKLDWKEGETEADGFNYRAELRTL